MPVNQQVIEAEIAGLVQRLNHEGVTGEEIEVECRKTADVVCAEIIRSALEELRPELERLIDAKLAETKKHGVKGEDD